MLSDAINVLPPLSVVTKSPIAVLVLRLLFI